VVVATTAMASVTMTVMAVVADLEFLKLPAGRGGTR
jgi:hypothetical protein